MKEDAPVLDDSNAEVKEIFMTTIFARERLRGMRKMAAGSC